MAGKKPNQSASFRMRLFADVIGFLLAGLMWCCHARGTSAQEPVSANPEDVTARVGVGGFGRYTTDRWGIARATISNRGDTSASSLIVVTPAGSGGLQYARQIDVPPNVAVDTIWPMRLSNAESSGTIEFQFLHFPGGEDDGVIRHEQQDRQIPTFSGITRNGPVGLTGLIVEPGDFRTLESPIHDLLRTMRFSRNGDQNVVAFTAREISERRECLDPLDHLGISDPQLLRCPQACKAIRTWVQSGGRLLIQLERTGCEVAAMLLGDSLPLTLVGATSTNTVQLDLNPEYQNDQYPIRAVNRSFEEPVRYLRVVPGGGETIWRVDNWPVAVRVSIGSGIVVVTTISPDVFLERKIETTEGSPAFSLIPSSRRMLESLFSPRTPPLIAEAVASQRAAAMVGYEIPSSRTALLLLMTFPVLLITSGIMLQRRASGERLIWVLPMLAILAAIPAVVFGLRIRSVAPTTVIEAIVLHSAAGASEVASTGFATIFVPRPTDLLVSSGTSAVLEVAAESTNLDYRRLVWTGPAENHWRTLRQPTGLKTYPTHGVVRLNAPLQAIATFDENGVRGKLLTASLSAPFDPIFAGDSPDRLNLLLNERGEFRGGVADVLAPGQFLNASFMSDDQKSRVALLESVFSKNDGLEVFPALPSVLFWTESEEPTLILANEGVRRKQTVLVVQPVQWLPPEAGKTITIPPPLLPYRSIPTAEGGYSSVFNNARREWTEQEEAGETVLQFQIPAVCGPFEAEAADVSLLIRAASRIVTVSSGDANNLQKIYEVKSPLGTQSITIPVDLIQNSSHSGRLLLRISVSDLDDAMKSDSRSGEQDDNWKIERILLTLKGHRMSETPSAAAVPSAVEVSR